MLLLCCRWFNFYSSYKQRTQIHTHYCGGAGVQQQNTICAVFYEAAATVAVFWFKPWILNACSLVFLFKTLHWYKIQKKNRFDSIRMEWCWMHLSCLVRSVSLQYLWFLLRPPVYRSSYFRRCAYLDRVRLFRHWALAPFHWFLFRWCVDDSHQHQVLNKSDIVLCVHHAKVGEFVEETSTLYLCVHFLSNTHKKKEYDNDDFVQFLNITSYDGKWIT